MVLSLPVIAYGQTAEVYAYGDARVLKLFREGIPSALAEDEYRICECVHEAGIATPEAVARIEIEGRQGIVFQRIAGRSMLQAIMHGALSADEAGAQMAALHAGVHRLDAPAIPSQRGILAGRIREAPLLTEQEKRAIAERMARLPEDAKLCHGDFHPDNVLVSDSRAWIIDWMTGTSGHPAADAARTMLLLRFGSMPPETPADVVALINRMRQRLLDAYTGHYLRQSGLNRADIEEWFVPLAAARLVEWLPDEEKRELVRFVRDSLA
ncbi:phosphotransferase [Paenibacillus lycopersici]|uniref:Phosphotransferase n=1 Tax=Paenibacillus lycopersici TaxID=2704462 RepID=A0A6C0G639_9BACL|nr:phosphotransferase [Paenibacillus lycopersici]